MKTSSRPQIITHFTDQDLYSFTVGLFYLINFSESIGEYSFVDRNDTVYRPGFAEEVMDQVRMMEGLSPTEEEISFLKARCGSYMHSWFFTFLRGVCFRAKDVKFWQDEDGYLHGRVNGPLWRTIYWEQPLLAIISELSHEDDAIDKDKEYQRSYERGLKMIEAGVDFSDMGTRRRFSKEHHYNVLKSLVQAQVDSGKICGNQGLIGTSNVYYCMKLAEHYPWLKCIGTMSHQMISAIAAIYGPREANYEAIERWNNLYRGHMGVFLFDCLGSDAFLRNFSKQHAKLLDGYRIDSGDDMQEFYKIYEKICSFGLEPSQKSVIFSNGLKPEQAISIHQMVAGRMKDSFGIGTALTCNIENVKPANIVVKLTGIKLTPRHEQLHCIKLSSDIGKATGDPDTIAAYKIILGI